MLRAESERDKVRTLIRSAMEVFHEDGELPKGSTVMPRAHFDALRPEAPLVIGARGTGKSFWHNVLTNGDKLAFVREAYPEIRFPSPLDIRSAFSARQEGDETQPPKDFLVRLGTRPPQWRTLWQAIMAAKLLPDRIFQAGDSWAMRLEKTQQGIEAFNAGLRKKDSELALKEDRILLVFDALDTISDDWEVSIVAARELLKLVTDYRLLSAIRFKVFLRADLARDPKARTFPDASKLFANPTELIWYKEDLFTLFYQRLANTDGGEIFRRLVEGVRAKAFQKIPEKPTPSWILERALRVDERFHRELFEKIAGKAMSGGASGTKRGIPYSWIYNHLLDARGAVSPRSFCVALYEAARDTRPASSITPLAPKDLEEGVRKASTIRVGELNEEYPWIDRAMRALQRTGARVPCERDAMIAAWEEDGTIDSILADREVKKGLPGTVRHGDYSSFLDALESIGIVSPMPEGDRYQVPDVYRVAFGLGRKGGIPVKRR